MQVKSLFVGLDHNPLLQLFQRAGTIAITLLKERQQILVPDSSPFMISVLSSSLRSAQKVHVLGNPKKVQCHLAPGNEISFCTYGLRSQCLDLWVRKLG